MLNCQESPTLQRLGLSIGYLKAMTLIRGQDTMVNSFRKILMPPNSTDLDDDRREGYFCQVRPSHLATLDPS